MSSISHIGHEIINRKRYLHSNLSPKPAGKPTWLRDIIDARDECRKILHPRVIDKLSLENRQQIESVIITLVDGCKRCNIHNMIDAYCGLQKGCFDKIPFSVCHALDEYTTYDQIVRFLYNFYRTICPMDLLFGTQQNYKIFISHLRSLIECGVRVNNITYKDVRQFDSVVIDIKKIPWLQLVANDQAREEIFYLVLKLLIRIFQELIKTYFYGVLSNPYGDQIFYYRYSLWDKISMNVLQKYIRNDLLQPHEIESTQDLPLFSTSSIRYMLKKDDIRPICLTFGNRHELQKQTNRFKAILRKILKNICDNRFKSGYLFNMKLFLDDLKQFKESNQRDCTNIYMVRTDIADCFPSVDQDKLKAIIDSNLYQLTDKHGTIVIYNYLCLTDRGKRYYRLTLDPNEVLRNSRYKSIELQNTHRMTPEDVSLNYVHPYIIWPILKAYTNGKIGFYLKRGLRQGAALSPLLTSIYLRSAFRQYLGDLINAEDCRLYCYVDDILFITTDLEKGRKFLHIMLKGFKEYGLRSNLDKLFANFNLVPHEARLTTIHDYMIFYRHKIDIMSLECSYNYESYSSMKLQYTQITNPYADEFDLMAFAKTFVFTSFTLILIDMNLNSRQRVVINIFERMLLSAYRVAIKLIISIKWRRLENQIPELLDRIIKCLCNRSIKFIDKKVKRGSIVNDLSANELRLITYTAYCVVWNNSKMKNRRKELKTLNSGISRINLRNNLKVSQQQMLEKHFSASKFYSHMKLM